MTTLDSPKVKAVLDGLFAQAEKQAEGWESGEIARPDVDASATLAEQVEAFSGMFLSVTRDTGRFLYSLVRATRPAVVVEYGMSFGISTLHLASALRDNGGGRVFTTELSPSKIASARASFAEAGLDDLITVLEGDARETLTGVEGPVGLLLLDGWPELDLPVLSIIEPKLADGAVVLAENAGIHEGGAYLDRVRAFGSGYVSSSFIARGKFAFEVSCRAA